jgi:hypothetical protein
MMPFSLVKSDVIFGCQSCTYLHGTRNKSWVDRINLARNRKYAVLSKKYTNFVPWRQRNFLASKSWETPVSFSFPSVFFLFQLSVILLSALVYTPSGTARAMERLWCQNSIGAAARERALAGTRNVSGLAETPGSGYSINKPRTGASRWTSNWQSEGCQRRPGNHAEKISYFLGTPEEMCNSSDG